MIIDLTFIWPIQSKDLTSIPLAYLWTPCHQNKKYNDGYNTLPLTRKHTSLVIKREIRYGIGTCDYNTWIELSQIIMMSVKNKKVYER